MLRDITIGQYFPGNSLIHKADPRMKIVLSFLYIAVIFCAKNVFCYLAVLCSAFLLVWVSGISFRVILKGIKPVLFVLLFTMLMNVFFTQGETVLFSFWKITVYVEGVYRAVFMALRVVALIVGTGIFLTYTTSPIVLTDAIESLLSPLKKIKVPVHDFAMMMTIALRFIPTLINETDKIMNAQKARGADFSNGSLARRAKALVPILVPLFVSAFNRAEELATAMECRCYRGDVGRTRYVKFRVRAADFLYLFLMLAFGAGIIIGNRYIPVGFSV
ncbi:MAG: energy-coupling factor transporter transmembrane protein EcfT [Clostridia bacterium]|nr:energy-coupling factor transporter transmembrane protein EcfT [Clostridia bacterium]